MISLVTFGVTNDIFIDRKNHLINSILWQIYDVVGGFARDMKTDQIKNIPERELAMLVNLVLILLGVLDVLFTLPSCIICLRDLCECYSADRWAIFYKDYKVDLFFIKTWKFH